MEKVEKAVYGAGCFWHVQDEFDKVSGVLKTEAGFMGGTRKNPGYEDVCAGATGHAEVVLLEYDPLQVLPYERLLDVFWSIHDPTQYHRQGPDVGSQYRSAIFYYDEKQKAVAMASKERLEKSGKYRKPLVTEIKPAQDFWLAEEYHQEYYLKSNVKSCGIPLRWLK